MNRYLQMSTEVQSALKNGEPVVALESTILSHGMPSPENAAFALEIEQIVRGAGAVPATTAVIDGQLRAGLTRDELLYMCQTKENRIGKVSRHDLPTYAAIGRAGATTVSATMVIAKMAGIRFFVTGGIGGVHRGASQSFDISADLQELAHTDVAVVSSGAKSILDLKLTLEYLETFGVPVIGYGTSEFPAFFSRTSHLPLDYAVASAEEAARIAKTKWSMGLSGGLLIANPIPAPYAVDYDEMEVVITRAVEQCRQQGVSGKESTPFILRAIKQMTGGRSFVQLSEMVKANAVVGAQVARAYAAL